MSKKFIIAIDGPAGSGKSTSAKIVARRLGFLYIDTGAMYRAITYLALKKGIIENNNSIIEETKHSKIELKHSDGITTVLLNDENITDFIRTPEVNFNVSDVSKIQKVREILVQKQRQMAEENFGVVMEGRDITTVVFPDADVKVFMTASIEQRAERRVKEYEEKGVDVAIDDIRKNLLDRDRIDSSRNVSPLTKAPDAIEVNTSDVTIEEQVKIILNKVKEKAKAKGIEIPQLEEEKK